MRRRDRRSACARVRPWRGSAGRGIGVHVTRVDGDVRAVARHIRPQPFDYGVNAALQLVAVAAQLFGKAVGGVDARRVAFTAENPLQLPMLCDQGRHLRPGRQRVEALGQREPDHGADRIAGAARPAGSFKFLDQPPYLRRVEEPFERGR